MAKSPILSANGEQLIGAKPNERNVNRPIVPVRMQDAEGVCEFAPQDDLTPLEAYKLANIIAWCVTQPPPRQDPRNGDIILTHTLWRKYIADNQLERHFAFSDAIPLRAPGHA